MEYLEIILPTLLLLIAFGYKNVVDKRFKMADFIERALEVPVEIVFLSASFLVAYTLKDINNHAFGLLSLLIGILITTLVYITSKRSHEAFLNDELGSCKLFAACSFLPSLFSYFFCVKLLVA
ncbi:hypothetical protein PhaeoP75_01307 [Phaeobacter gallaeciensis]|uniref:Uncharacterized protein n=1 Tax=Phaeobacter gallaeciensis TaxID=60890 RepID=A0AAD0ECD8_9RHOB|nr:hypothetical protein Gal_01265 [Phaeobacter gallaeciensis DSM 26640]ATE92301.1 hypothetical protein PhaeoP11_01260 [Phaeobacter gallaeciensis]ATE97880.1 hypothetical protein PhaeoP73_02589 [Phaeobacter gallaeciensis]ATF00963.1 hypothetical protein PhaeoP75_01307 [Phaeobacter gallaeciensis]ATF05343.1 hypothetical protein PhaeoP63_01255 [Phaeobacter gallaeciensis]